MRKSKFTEEQMVALLKEQEAGISIEELVRKHGINRQSFYRWKAKFGGMNVSDVKKMRLLEEEKARLKNMVANISLENYAMKDLIQKKFCLLRRSVAASRFYAGGRNSQAAGRQGLRFGTLHAPI
jgi:putative transposase